MKKTIIFAAFAALVLASSCSERVDVPELAGENVISLDLIYAEPATRATTPGEGLENAVNSVQYFFYNDVDANPIYVSEYIQNPTLTDLKYSVTLTAGENGVPDLTTMFKNTECIVYGVFNADEIAAAPLATVKETALANTFAHRDGVEGDSSGSDWVVTSDAEAVDHPKYFVMAGELALTRVSGQAYAAKGTVDMNRVAAKIAVDLKIKKSITVGEGAAVVVWNPMLGGKQVRVYPNNMVGNAVLGGVSTDPSFPTDLGQFNYKEVVYNSTIGSDYVTDDGTYYVIKSQQDFYTYPIEWTRGGDDEPFIKIIVPWRSADGTTQKEIYYKVMLPMESIEANKYYKLTVVVSLLGTEGEPEVTLEPLSALVVNWQEGAPVNGTISAAKYLSVERGVVTATESYDTAEGRFDFYTETSGTDFAASDPVTVRIKEIKQKNLKTRNWEYLYQNFTAYNSEITKRGYPTTTGVHYYSAEEIESDWVKLVGDNYLEIGHQLNSDLTSPLMDVTPYYYTVVLSLPSDIDSSHKYDKTVTFVQWPEVYVVEDPNSGTNTSSSSTSNGGVYLNGYTISDNWSNGNWPRYYTSLDGSYGNYLGGVHGLTGQNQNGSMYVLTISVSNAYTIGDPRGSVSNPTFTYSGETYVSQTRTYDGAWISAPWTEGSNHTLMYYHPASSTNTSNMIAPKIRVASSYGVCTTGISQTNAIARCAAYQEDGIPAGRWRLPTMAEVQFISTLSALGRIPYLFGANETATDYYGNNVFDSDSYYWTANGRILVNNGSTPPKAKPASSGSDESVRCVYDEWFWGDATKSRPVNASTFTWGDRNY